MFVDLERREVQRGYTPLPRRPIAAGGARREHVLPAPAARRVAAAAPSRHPADLRIRRADRHRPQRGARQRDVVVAGVRRPPRLERRRLLPVVHPHERHRPPRALRTGGGVDAAAREERRDRVPRRDAVCRPRQHRHARADPERLRRHVGARPRDGQHHARRREPRADERDHGRAEGLLRARRARARRWDR